jgi:hypothetical protein
LDPYASRRKVNLVDAGADARWIVGCAACEARSTVKTLATSLTDPGM